MWKNFLILPLLSLNLMAMDKDDVQLYADKIFSMVSLQEQQQYIQTLSEDQQMALYDRLCDVQIFLANNQIPSLEQEISLLEKQVRNKRQDAKCLIDQTHEQKANLTGRIPYKTI